MKSTFYRRTSGLFLLFAFCCVFPLSTEAQDTVERPYILETSAFMAMNLMPDSADFYELSFGYRPDKKNTFFLHGITWKYTQPLGIPYGAKKYATEFDYPGFVRDFGLGLGYQRFFWKGLYASLTAMPFVQTYNDKDGKLIQTGFQLYLIGHVGYQIDLFQGRLYIKPAIGFNYWPINTNLPETFSRQEKKWPAWFLFEPQLYIGYTFKNDCKK